MLTGKVVVDDGKPAIVLTFVDKRMAGEYVTRGCPSQRVDASR